MGYMFLTGKSGAGKTTWLLGEVGRARAAGHTVVGIITPPIFGKKDKLGIEAWLLPTDERFNLANVQPRVAQPTAPTRPDADLAWRFDDTAVQRINDHLQTLAFPAAQSPETLLVIDEIGPLELLKGAGFTAALDLLDKQVYEQAIVVIRPSLIELAQQRWPGSEVRTASTAGRLVL
ncbi:MAG: nucleoside-triphosphatase [Coriobacteriales bacterium]|jgi:nucleoside-triphosphatase THEP1|nr:nucleoside-triphosphatase [Coriobacteriales bacterium]